MEIRRVKSKGFWVEEDGLYGDPWALKWTKYARVSGSGTILGNSRQKKVSGLLQRGGAEELKGS